MTRSNLKKNMYSIGSNLENLTRDFLTGESKRFIQADFKTLVKITTLTFLSPLQLILDFMTSKRK